LFKTEAVTNVKAKAKPMELQVCVLNKQLSREHPGMNEKCSFFDPGESECKLPRIVGVVMPQCHPGDLERAETKSIVRSVL
jgi:hypothetical protein